jgi:hypothetical protein
MKRRINSLDALLVAVESLSKEEVHALYLALAPQVQVVGVTGTGGKTGTRVRKAALTAATRLRVQKRMPAEPLRTLLTE